MTHDLSNRDLHHRRLLQRLAVRRALRNAKSQGEPGVDYCLEEFDGFYQFVVSQYVRATGASFEALDESQTPILDKLLDFVKWMYESGFLEFLIGLFGAGIVMAVVASGRVMSDFMKNALADELLACTRLLECCSP